MEELVANDINNTVLNLSSLDLGQSASETRESDHRPSELNVVAELSEDDEDQYFDAIQESAKEQQDRHEKGIEVVLPDNAVFEFVGISGHDIVIDEEGRKICTFKIEIRCKGAIPSFWILFRRYTHFRLLNESLLSHGFKVSPLPPKIILGAFISEFNIRRKEALSEWLRDLFSNNVIVPDSAKVPGTSVSFDDIHLWPSSLHQCPEFRTFFCQDINIPPYLTPALSSDTMLQPIPHAPRVGTGDFATVKMIGQGAFGTVLLVQKKTDGRLFAMKVLTKTNIDSLQQKSHTRTERRVLGTITHPFIVKLYYAFQTNKKLYLIIDYAAGGELFFHLSRLKKFSQLATCFYCAQITLALDALHKMVNGSYNRDLKPENILLDGEGHIKLADFGLAKENVTSAASGAHSLCGTIQYVSPEVLGRSPQGHGTAVDWWNLGMVTYEMLTGLPPWYSTNTQQMLCDIMHAPLHTLQFPVDVNSDAASFIFRLLNKQPEQRLGAAGGGAEVMNHKFFQGIDWDKMYHRGYAPPFNPCRKKGSDLDTINFDKNFTSKPVTALSSDDEGTAARIGNRARADTGGTKASEDTECTNYSDFTFSIDAANLHRPMHLTS